MAEIMVYPRLNSLIRNSVKTLCSGIVLYFVLFSLADGCSAQSRVQGSIESLRLGESQPSDVKLRFGEPDQTAKLWDWKQFITREGLFSYQSVDAKLYEEGGKGIRSTFGLTYSKLGLVFTLLDRPWRLTEIEITNPDVVVNGLRVGDSLRNAKRVLTNKYFDWWSTDKLDIWWLDNQEGVRVAFQRDPNAPRSPMKLISRPRIVKIVIYDKTSTFSVPGSAKRL